MTDDEKQARTWNMNAHFAWALAMWGSGEHARSGGSTLLAAVGHYYSAFHAGFAVACTDHTINLRDYENVHHGKVHEWTGRLLGQAAHNSFDRLRHMREKLNYMGMGDPMTKFLLVQGRVSGFEFEDGKLSFEEALALSSELSQKLVLRALEHLEAHCAAHQWPGPKRGDHEWQEGYLQEDLLRTVFTTDEARRAVLGLAFSLLS